MYSRETINEVFSTFIQFSDDNFSNWLTEPRLKRNMEFQEKKESENQKSERFWSLFWYKKWRDQTDILAKNHLLAYLQESCYWTSQKTVSRFPNLSYKLSDCFQMAIAEINQVLQSYNPNYGSSLSNYASLVFKSIINNTVRQKLEIDICTDWSLLRKVSKKRLIASLENANYAPEKITNYCLIWRCFKTIYIPKQQKLTQKLSAPSEDILQKIIVAYQTELINYPSLSQKEADQLTPEIVKKSLQECANLIRQYLYPQTISLNITPSGQDSGELLQLISSQEKSPLEYLITEEEISLREQKKAQINKILLKSLNNINPEVQTLFKMYYQENLTQEKIAEKLDTKQYKISRRIARGREILLRDLLIWTKNSFNLTINTEIIKEMSVVLEEWLNIYYQNIALSD